MKAPRQKRARSSEFYSFSAPIAGWISNRALADPSGPGVPQGAAVLDNYFPRSGSVKLRRGKQRYATLMQEDRPVTALFTYKNGANERFFGANDQTIYDLTIIDIPEPGALVTEDDELISTETGDWFGWESTVGAEVMSGFTGGDWSVVQFTTGGNAFLIGVNGQDTGFIYNGSVFLPWVSGGVTAIDYASGTSAFVVGEVVTGGASSATGTVTKVVGDAATGTLYLTDVTGTFEDAEAITGDGTGAAEIDGAPSIAAPGPDFSTSGLTSADFSFVWVYKERLWLVQKDSLNAWYADDIDSVGGDFTIFPMQGIFDTGGSLLFGQNWSLEGGSSGGLSEQNVFVSTEGEAAIYQGIDPGQAASWAKTGLYQIGKPLGKRGFFRGGGDLAICTSVGLVPLSKAISLDVTALSVATVSYNISDAWSDAVNARGFNDWSALLWPELKMALISPPNVTGGDEPVLFVVNSETGAWCRFLNWEAISMTVFRGELYIGSSAGRVYKCNVSGTDEGATYTGVVMPLFEDMGSPGSIKVGKIVRGVSRANDRVNALATMNYDFNEVPDPAPDAAPATPANIWGEAVWGSATWGTEMPTLMNQAWQSGSGMGYTLAPVYQVTSGSLRPLDDELIRVEVTYTTSEIVT